MVSRDFANSALQQSAQLQSLNQHGLQNYYASPDAALQSLFNAQMRAQTNAAPQATAQTFLARLRRRVEAIEAVQGIMPIDEVEQWRREAKEWERN